MNPTVASLTSRSLLGRNRTLVLLLLPLALLALCTLARVLAGLDAEIQRELQGSLAPDLLTATNDALTTARTIVDQQAALTTLISGGTALTDQANTFLAANAKDLVRFIQNSAVLLDVVYANRHAGITDAIMTNRMLNAKISTIVKNGYIVSSTSFLLNVPPYYTSADCPRFGPAKGDNCSGLARAGVGAMLDRGAR